VGWGKRQTADTRPVNSTELFDDVQSPGCRLILIRKEHMRKAREHRSERQLQRG
jgi:hypothetical protein